MEKRAFIVALLFTIISIDAMDRTLLKQCASKKDDSGRLLLHKIAVSIPLYEITEEIDKLRATTAAIHIAYFNISVYESDNFGKNPFEYATENKDKLPHLFKVIQAGKDKQDIEKLFPKQPADTINSLQYPKMLPTDKANQWIAAMDILSIYLPKPPK